MDKKDELKIEEIVLGKGKEVKSGNTIVVHYKGTFLDGKKFDSSYDRKEPFEVVIGAGHVIKGWDIGIIGMKEKGKRKLTIPHHLAYGKYGVGSIPGFSTLVFEVELIKIK